MKTEKIIEYISKNRLVKYVQSLELSCFAIAGFLLNYGFFESVVLLIIGIFLAIIASESAIREHELKESEKNGSK